MTPQVKNCPGHETDGSGPGDSLSKSQKAARQGDGAAKERGHATLGSLVVQASEDPREAVSAGLTGSPAHKSWSLTLPHISREPLPFSMAVVPFLGV